MISRSSWQVECDAAVSHLRRPSSRLSIDAEFQLTQVTVKPIERLLRHAHRRLTRLGSTAIQHASACDRFMVYECEVDTIACCFTSRTRTEGSRVQVCFCYARQNGSTRRTKFFVMESRFMIWINSCYLLGHANGFALNRVREWLATIGDIATTTTTIESIQRSDLSVHMEPLRTALNGSMAALAYALRTWIRSTGMPVPAAVDGADARRRNRRVQAPVRRESGWHRRRWSHRVSSGRRSRRPSFV